MALDMANSDASSAKVRVLVSFYLLVTDDNSSFSARTSAIHTEKFNVPLSSDGPCNYLFNISLGYQELLSKALAEKPEIRVELSESRLTLTQD